VSADVTSSGHHVTSITPPAALRAPGVGSRVDDLRRSYDAEAPTARVAAEPMRFDRAALLPSQRHNTTTAVDYQQMMKIKLA